MSRITLGLAVLAVAALTGGISRGDDWGKKHQHGYGNSYRHGGYNGHNRLHDDLDHNAFHRESEHRDAHRYPMTWKQHEQLHDALDHDAFHDELLHRQVHRQNTAPCRTQTYYNPGYYMGYGSRGFSFWISR